MKHSGTILVAGVDKVIPDGDLETGLLHHETYVGAVLLSGGKLMVVRKDRKELEKGSLELIKSTQTKYKAMKRIFFCGTAPEKYAKEDMQPFVLLTDDKGTPTMVAFVTGNFDPVESDFSEVFNAVQEKLEPHVLGLFEKEGNDIAKLTKRLKLAHMKGEFLGLLGKSNISICLASASGDIITFTNNPNQKATDYGWTSGEVEAHVEPVKKDEDDLFAESGAVPGVVEKKEDKDDLFSGDGQHKTDVKPTSLKRLPPHLQAAADKKIADKDRLAALANGSATEVKKPITEAAKVVASFQGKPVKDGFEVVKFTPAQMTDEKAKREFIINRCGQLFKGWKEKECTEFLAPMRKTARSLQELGDKLKSSTATEAPAPDKAKPEVQPDPASSPQPDVGEPNHNPPVIPAKHLPQLEKVLKDMPAFAFMNVRGEEITNPDILKDFETKYPDFAIALGLPGMAATIPWTFEHYKRIGANSLDGLARCALDTKVAWVKMAQELAALKKKHNIKDELPAHLKKTA